MREIKFCKKEQHNYFYNLIKNYNDILYKREFNIVEIKNNEKFNNLIELKNFPKLNKLFQKEIKTLNHYNLYKIFIISSKIFLLLIKKNNNKLLIDFIYYSPNIESIKYNNYYNKIYNLSLYYKIKNLK